MNAKKISGALLAVFLTVAPISAKAQTKTAIPIGAYCEKQKSQNPAQVHAQYTPFSPSSVNVNVRSKVHGNLTLHHFNCETLIPICGSGGFASTKGTLSSVHASLGKYNASDDPAVVEALKLLGRNSTIITPGFASNSASVKHLEDSSPGHGLSLYTTRNGVFDIGETSKAVYSACAAEIVKQ